MNDSTEPKESPLVTLERMVTLKAVFPQFYDLIASASMRHARSTSPKAEE